MPLSRAMVWRVWSSTPVKAPARDSSERSKLKSVCQEASRLSSVRPSGTSVSASFCWGGAMAKPGGACWAFSGGAFTCCGKAQLQESAASRSGARMWRACIEFSGLLLEHAAARIVVRGYSACFSSIFMRVCTDRAGFASSLTTSLNGPSLASSGLPASVSATRTVPG